MDQDAPVSHTGNGNMQRLLYRRQFVLGPQFVDTLPDWQQVRIAPRLVVTVHPDLACVHVRRGDYSITLLGFILDPDRPQDSNAEVTDRLLRQLESDPDLDRFLERTYRLGGRWIIIAENRTETRLFHDPCGFRQVFHSTPSASSSAVWCASQPRLLADLLDFAVDEAALSFITGVASRDKEYWWPGTSSPYKEIRHLLANHYLDLKTGITHRYWPKGELPKLSTNEFIAESTGILRGLIASAINRFPLALTLTAGWDTRVVLAATKDYAERIFYFTMAYWHLTTEHSDVKIPSLLLSKFGLTHHVINCPSSMETQFEKIYKKNVPNAHDVYGSIAQGMYSHYPADHVMVKGVASEIARRHYQSFLPNLYHQKVTAHLIAGLTGMGTHPFALSHHDEWLRGIRDNSNIDVLDLLFWEQRLGNWQAMSQLEWDIIQDVFSPFNCRVLAMAMLSQDAKDRDKDHPRLHKLMIENLWPETLSEPINPGRQGMKAKERLMNALEYSPFIASIPKPLRKLGGRILHSRW